MRRRNVVLLVLLAVLVVGCVSTIDPETGQKMYAVKESVAKGVDTAVAVIDTAAGVFPTGGVVGAIVGIISTLGGCYVRWKKPLTESTIMLDKVTAGLRAAGDVIENVVKPNSELWSKAKPKLLKAEANGATNADKV